MPFASRSELHTEPPVAKRSRTTKLRCKLSLFAASFVLSLLAVEVVFRALGIRGRFYENSTARVIPPVEELPDRTPYGFYPNATVVFQYDGDPRGSLEPGHTMSHRYNSIGWRGREHAVEKPPGVFRILGLGDSFLYGQGVRRKDICLKQLPDLLNDAVEPKSIETINSALCGLNTTDQRNQLLLKGLDFDPDLVILYFVLNDVEEDMYRPGPKVEFFSDYTDISQSSDWLSNYSYFWSWGRKRVLNHLLAEKYVRYCVSQFEEDSPGWIACKQALRDIKLACERNDVAFCVVIFPFLHNLNGNYAFQPIHEIVTDYCKNQEIPFLDLRDAFRGYNGPELWVHPTDQHPNEIAHEIAAEATAQFLKDHAETLLRTKE